MARDNYLPHLFAIRGDRQTFGNGILVLAAMAGALLIAVGGNTNTLIPLFAIGVFIGFTLSQTGLVVHWRKLRPPGWKRRALINGTGAVVTAIATIVFLISKFTEGAWVVVIAIPGFIVLFLRIHAYYERAAKELRFDMMPPPPERKRTIVIVPVNRISRLTEHALGEAESLGQEVIAVTVVLEGGDEATAYTERLFDQWNKWNCGIPLRVLHTDYASVVQPIVAFIDELREQHPEDQLVVLIPVIRPDKLRYRILHNQLDLVLSSALRSRSDIVVARVTVPLDAPEHQDEAETRSHPKPEPGPNPAPTPDPARAQDRARSHPVLKGDLSAPSNWVALLDERGRPLLGVLTAEDLRLPLDRPRARLLQIGRRSTHELLGGLQCEWAVACDALGQRDGGVEHVAWRHHLIDQTQRQRAPGIDRDHRSASAPGRRPAGCAC